MFLKKSTATIKGTQYHHYKIVESYRDDGKIKHRILFNVGKLTDEQAEQLKLAIKVQNDPGLVVTHEREIAVTKSIAYLDIMVLHQMWQQWNLAQFFLNDRWVEALVLNRCIDPTSKIRLQSWAEQTILPAFIPALRNYDEYDVYRELDRIAKQEDALQVFLYEQLKQRQRIHSNAFFYDITSSYFEGSQCVLAKLGYSRDHRPDREQVVIALMITPEGYPFYWRVLDGNTQDVTTIEALVHDVRRRFGIAKCTLVFDRGMVSATNLKSIEQEQLKYVSAMDKDEIRTTLLDEVMPVAATSDDWEQVMERQAFRPCDEDALLFYRPLLLAGSRYIVTFDVGRFHDQTKHRLRQCDQMAQLIQDLNHALRTAKNSRKREAVEREVQRLLARKGMKKLTTITIEPLDIPAVTAKGKARTITSFQVHLQWCEDQLKELARLDGLTCFITNMSDNELADQEVITWYRRKNKVEESFHELKSHLKLRPMHVTRAERVKAHVTICMLANFLMNDMEQRLQAAGYKQAPNDLLQTLEVCRIHRMEISAVKRKWLSIQEMSEHQQRSLQALQCPELLQERFQKEILAQAEICL
ncbi:IS1634 family transposase [Paenibacillus koleovorans]|uniref:IS1634 family transposase n=1 Tax=Paenibacillus koleovorans TaxID=121608 RepID=UPI000FDC39B4|nr:IS1634 family transposase [Paenibacillus koleovorans]